MSDFSEKCKYYLVENGSSIYKLARNTPLDRTTTQKMLAGTRLPSKNFVVEFCHYLRLNSAERQEVLELYQIEKIGKATYHNRKYIQSLLAYIAYAEEHNTFFEPFPSISAATTSADNLIADVLREEFTLKYDSTIRTNIPADYTNFYHLLIQYQKKFGTGVSVLHTFAMHPNSTSIANSNINLEKLYFILPFIFSQYKNYSPYYFYSRSYASDSAAMMFPYYIITSSSVLILSADFKNAVLYLDFDIIQTYREEFEKIIAQAKPLFQTITEPLKALTHYNSFLERHGFPNYSLEPQPCICGLLADSSQVEYLLPKDFPNRDVLFSSEQIVSEITLKQLTAHKNIYTRTGLDTLANHGQLMGALAIFSKPLPKEERKKSLNFFRQLNNSSDTFFMVRDELKLPRGLHFEVYSGCYMNIILTDANSFHFFTLEESSVCEAFYDFATALSESDYVYTKEETNRILTRYIDELD